MTLPVDAAAQAAASVRQAFLRRCLAVPRTRLAAVDAPSSPGGHWHYWWQAHLLDALIDAGMREPSSDSLAQARRLARGIWLRNGARWRNSYYDDMAWLALALQRLDLAGSPQSGPARSGTPRDRRRTRGGVRVLGRTLRSAHTAELGGGVYWNTTRDYKNTPSTAPTAIFLAREGDMVGAQELLDWLRGRLRDDTTGLYLDGVRSDGSVERTIHTYNQGTVLGALVAVGGEDNLAQAAELIRAVKRHTADAAGTLPLAAKGDAGLFTGILCRYLAVAVRTPGLAPDAATAARLMLSGTAEWVWAGRIEAVTSDGKPAIIFPPLQDGSTSLSSQVQAWTILEAEGSCRGRPDHPSRRLDGVH